MIACCPADEVLEVLLAGGVAPTMGHLRSCLAKAISCECGSQCDIRAFKFLKNEYLWSDLGTLNAPGKIAKKPSNLRKPPSDLKDGDLICSFCSNCEVMQATEPHELKAAFGTGRINVARQRDWDRRSRLLAIRSIEHEKKGKEKQKTEVTKPIPEVALRIAADFEF